MLPCVWTAQQLADEPKETEIQEFTPDPDSHFSLFLLEPLLCPKGRNRYLTHKLLLQQCCSEELRLASRERGEKRGWGKKILTVPGHFGKEKAAKHTGGKPPVLKSPQVWGYDIQISFSLSTFAEIWLTSTQPYLLLTNSLIHWNRDTRWQSCAQLSIRSK